MPATIEFAVGRPVSKGGAGHVDAELDAIDGASKILPPLSLLALVFADNDKAVAEPEPAALHNNDHITQTDESEEVGSSQHDRTDRRVATK